MSLPLVEPWVFRQMPPLSLADSSVREGCLVVVVVGGGGGWRDPESPPSGTTQSLSSTGAGEEG